MKKIAAIVTVAAFGLLLAGCERAQASRADTAIPSGSSELQAFKTVPSGDAGVPLEAAASGCGTAVKSGTTIETFSSGGVQRSYRLHVPKGYDGSKPLALVVNYHGYSSNAKEQEAYSRMVAQADRSGFITVTPDGTNNPQRWYIYGKLERGYVDDFAFTRDLVNRVSGKLCVDAKRIYATGISNGGGMSSIAGCQLSDIFAAIAPVAGSPYSEPNCKNAPPVPVIAFHGTDDKYVPFEGGPSGRLGLPATGARENSRQWAAHNGCAPTLSSQRIASDVLFESYGGCANGADVQLYVIEGGGHTWPGSIGTLTLGKSTRSIDATALMWAFFQAHPKP